VNAGTQTAPVAIGAHPYFRVGDVPSDELTVTVRGASWYPVDERFIPTGREPVEGTRYDLRSATRLGDRVLDTAFTDLPPDADGGSSVTVSRPDGRTVTVWLGPAYRYVELFTGDTLPDPARRRRGLGIEPMTAAPNAFVTGDGLRVLEPGETSTATWELRRGDH
jgi:aldose 1-epimerase